MLPNSDDTIDESEPEVPEKAESVKSDSVKSDANSDDKKGKAKEKQD